MKSSPWWAWRSAFPCWRPSIPPGGLPGLIPSRRFAMSETMRPAGPILRLPGVKRGFGSGDTRIEVIFGASLQVLSREMVALIGPSGSGKSTLLQICGLLEPAEAGRIEIAGHDAGQMSDAE